MKQIPIIFVFFALSSCVSTYQIVPLAENETKPSMVVYVKGYLSSYTYINVFEDEKFVGRVRKNGFIAWSPESKEKVTIRVQEGRKNIYYTVYPQQNKNYYLKVSKKVGLFANRLHVENKSVVLGSLRKPALHMIAP